jgi:uncharacterized repeat protein (TIGR01451 family)
VQEETNSMTQLRKLPLLAAIVLGFVSLVAGAGFGAGSTGLGSPGEAEAHTGTGTAHLEIDLDGDCSAPLVSAASILEGASITAALCLNDFTSAPVNLSSITSFSYSIAYTDAILSAVNGPFDGTLDKGANPNFNEGHVSNPASWDCNDLDLPASQPNADPSPASLSCEGPIAGSPLAAAKIADLTVTGEAVGVTMLTWTDGSGFVTGADNPICAAGGGIDCTDAEITVEAAADIELDKDCAPASPAAGDQVTCTLTVTNNSASTAAPNVVVTDVLMPDKIYDDAASDSRCGLLDPLLANGITNVVFCGELLPPLDNQIGLNPGDSTTIDIVYTAPLESAGKEEPDTAIAFAANIGLPLALAPADPNLQPVVDALAAGPCAADPDPTLCAIFVIGLGEHPVYSQTGGFSVCGGPGPFSPLQDPCNNYASAFPTIASADVDVVKTADDTSYQSGDTITWTVTASVGAGSPATQVVIEDTMGANSALVTAALTGASAVAYDCLETLSDVADIVGQVATCSLVDDGTDGGGPEDALTECAPPDAVDDDGDGYVNDGCPQVGLVAEYDAMCHDAVDGGGDGTTSEENLVPAVSDTAVNDGCPTYNETVAEIPAGGSVTLTLTSLVAEVSGTVVCDNSVDVTFADPLTVNDTHDVICRPSNVQMVKSTSEGPLDGTEPNNANLFLCVDPNPEGDGPDNPNCEYYDSTGPDFLNNNGMGHLVVFEHLLNVEGDLDGVGAFEFQLKFDHKIFDIEIFHGHDLNADGDCADPGETQENDTPATEDECYLYTTGRIPTDGGGVGGCSMTIVTENWILFGCVSKNPQDPVVITPGPTENDIVASLHIAPEPDLKWRLTPGQKNGVNRTILDENCEAADIYGDPLSNGNNDDDGDGAYDEDPTDNVDNDQDGDTDEDGPNDPLPGIVTGGLIEACEDFTITVRILEGDLNLDCVVDVSDDQMIAFRYGAFFGNLLYDPWFDMEPSLKDFDIDIKDLQKVFGRNGSTCEAPIPAQPAQQGGGFNGSPS